MLLFHVVGTFVGPKTTGARLATERVLIGRAAYTCFVQASGRVRRKTQANTPFAPPLGPAVSRSPRSGRTLAPGGQGSPWLTRQMRAESKSSMTA
jgi:hypothetical protein